MPHACTIALGPCCPASRGTSQQSQHQSRQADQAGLTAPPATNRSSRQGPRRAARLAAALTLAGTLTAPVHAADACQILLCLAAPSWRDIPQCVPPIHKLLRDLSLGKPFPVCGMAGPGGGASHSWAEAPSFCPPQYTRSYDDGIRNVYTCDYVGAVSVQVKGSLFARTWWNLNGETVTEFAPQAKQLMRSWDRRFDQDYAAWLSQQPVATTLTDSNP